MSTFCRNPLHPGPCKGWKKKLGVIAPGALNAINKAQQEKTAAKRAARAVAKSEAEKKVATGNKNVLAHPLLAKQATVTHTHTALGDSADKALAKGSKAILNKTEIKKYSQLKGAQVADLAASHGLLNDKQNKQDYAVYVQAKIAEALAADNQGGGSGKHYRAFLEQRAGLLGDALAAKYLPKCKTGDHDCDGLAYEGLSGYAAGQLYHAMYQNDPDGLNQLEADLSKLDGDGAKVRDYLKSKGVDVTKPTPAPAPAAPKAAPAPAAAPAAPKAAPAPAAAPAANLVPDKGMTDNQKLLMAQLGTSATKAAKKKALTKTVSGMSQEEMDSLPADVKAQLKDVLDLGGPAGKKEADAFHEPLTPNTPPTPEQAAQLAAQAAGKAAMGQAPVPLGATDKALLYGSVDPKAFLALPPDQQHALLADLKKMHDDDPNGPAKGILAFLTGSTSGKTDLSPAQIAAGQAVSNPFMPVDEVMDEFGKMGVAEYQNLPSDLHNSVQAQVKFYAESGDPKAVKLAEKFGIVPPPADEPTPAPAPKPGIPEPGPTASLPENVSKVEQVGAGPGLSPAAADAAGYAMGSKTGTAKQKLAAYEKLTPEEFQSLSPSSQKLILADLDKIHDKFLDPKKKEQVNAVKAKLGLATGGGAGSGGAADTTAPSTDLGAPAPTSVEQAAANAGADKILQINSWLDPKTSADPTWKAQLADKILNTKQHGTGFGNSTSKIFAEALTNDLLDKLDVTNADEAEKKHVLDPLTAEIKSAILQDGEPTPVLDALEALHEKALKHDSTKESGLQGVMDAIDAWHEKNKIDPLGGGPTDAQIAKLYEHAGLPAPSSLDAFVPGGETTVVNQLSNKAFAHHIITTAGLSGVDENWTGGETLMKISDALKADYMKALKNGDTTPGGLAAELPKMAKNTAEEAAKQVAANGWAPDSPIVESWKSSHLLAQIKDYLDLNGGGSPAGAGGGSTHSAPAAVKTAAKKAAPSGPTAAKLTGSHKLDSAQMLTIHSAYKSFGAGAYMSADDSEKWDNLTATASALAGKAGFPKNLSVADIMQTVDSQIANNLGVPNANMLENKIKDWMATPAGAAYVKNHVVSPAKVNSLAGYTAPPPKLPGLKAGQLIQTKPGPGKYDPNKPATDFHPHTPQQAQKELDDYLFNNGKVLSAGHWKAVTRYTGNAYTQMNAYLRGKDSSGNLYPPFKASEQTKKDVLMIQDAMMPLQSDHLLNRGTGWNFVPKEFQGADNLKKLIGKTFEDKAFMSTTVAGGGQGFHGPVKLTIEAPAGTHALFVKAKSQYSSENEMLLAAGTRFRVLSVEEKGGQTHVRVRVVTPK
jgi:hypothetical protein